MSLNDLLLFQKISDEYKEANKSFVVVTNSLNANELPEEIMSCANSSRSRRHNRNGRNRA